MSSGLHEKENRLSFVYLLVEKEEQVHNQRREIPAL